MNEMSKQTSWQFVDFGELLYLDGIHTQFAINDNESDIAFVFTEKDARLMATAPDLLDALQDALRQLEAWEVQIDGEWGECRTLAEIDCDGDNSHATIKARAAIAKATKEQTE